MRTIATMILPVPAAPDTTKRGSCVAEATTSPLIRLSCTRLRSLPATLSIAWNCSAVGDVNGESLSRSEFFRSSTDADSSLSPALSVNALTIASKRCWSQSRPVRVCPI